MSHEMAFELIGDEARLLALEPDWQALFADAGQPSPFLDFDWVLMCWRRVAADGPHRPFVAAVREAGRLVLAIPLQRQRYRWFFQRYYGLQTLFPQYNDGLVAPGGATADWVEVLRRGLGRSSTASLLVLNRVPAGSPLFAALAGVAQQAKLTTASAVELGQGYDAYLSSFSRPTRSQIRRMQKLLARTGTVEWRNATAQTLAGDISWLLQSKRNWMPPHGRKLRDWLLSPNYEQELRDIAGTWIATGRMTLATIEAGGHPVASGLVLHAGTKAIFYVTTYNADYAAVSPGRMLAVWLIEQAAQRGGDFMDFMAGGWAWKDRLKTTDFIVWRLKLPLR